MNTPDPSTASHQHTGLGSRLDGQPLSRRLCANVFTSQCTKPGSLTCTKCQLVAYCSKACQTLHWKKHRLDCKSLYIHPSWKPMWLVEGRMPAFVDPGSDGPSHQAFGPSLSYLWGNIAAIDCLNTSQNEQEAAASQDFNLCFAASGDLRNLISTTNGLPNDYTGKCKILCNDWNPLLVGHNLVILYALLSPDTPIEEAAELALHLMYSPLVTKAASSFFGRAIKFLRSAPVSENLSLGGQGKLRAAIPADSIEGTLNMLQSTYDRTTALQGYHRIMLSSQRQDYRDRYMSALEPGHRLAFSRFRQQGVLAPFSFDITHFTEPNRLLFSRQAEWHIRDSENPLFGWDVSTVLASGQSHGLKTSDLYGCLFFHVKDQFIKFATRVRSFNVSLTMTNEDARQLPKIILRGELAPFYMSCFDRIETSNLADYVTLPRILNDWGPLLNRQNRHATLLTYLMNWQGPDFHNYHLRNMDEAPITKYGSIMGIDIAQVHREGRYSPKMFQFMANIGAFVDESERFDKYLRNMDTHQTAASQGLKLRKAHRIHPARSGLSLSSPQRKLPDISKTKFYELFTVGSAQPSTRFAEFEVAL